MLCNTDRRTGYTLTELLTVLAVIGVLTAILLPVIWMERQKGRQSACASNLHQISVAIQMYVADNDSVYPLDEVLPVNRTGNTKSGTIWRDLLLPYLGGHFPECPDRSLPGIFSEDSHNRFLSGYAYNPFLQHTLVSASQFLPAGKTEATINYSTLTIVSFDTRTGIISISKPDTNTNWLDSDKTYLKDHKALILAQPEGATRHGGGANYAFADGHVRWYKPEQLSVKRHNDGVHPGFGL